MESISSLYKSIGRSMLGRYAVYAANLLSMMILARLFTPETFGTVAAIMVFFLFFQLMAEAGLGPAIINLDNLAPIDRDGLFGLTLSFGLFLTVVFSGLASVFLWFYELERVDEVVPYIALSIFFFAGSIVPNALLLREQAFLNIAKAGLIAEVLSSISTIFLAQFIDPIHALASKVLVSAATLFGIIWFFAGRTEFGRPMFGVKFSAIRPMLNFTGYQFATNLINYFSRNLDSILVGKYMGVGVLGVYDKSYQLMKYPLMLLTFAMTPAIQPVIRKLSGDFVKVEEIHRDFSFKLSLLASVAGLLVYLLADVIVLVALGDQWVDVVPIIHILAIAIPVQVVYSTNGSFFQAMNCAGLQLLAGMLSCLVMVSAITLGIIARDIELLCWYLVLAFHINFFHTYCILYYKVFKSSPVRFFCRMIPVAVVVATMALAA